MRLCEEGECGNNGAENVPVAEVSAISVERRFQMKPREFRVIESVCGHGGSFRKEAVNSSVATLELADYGPCARRNPRSSVRGNRHADVAGEGLSVRPSAPVRRSRL